MVSWRTFDGDDEAWDRAVFSLSDGCVFQSSGWARHKKDGGWHALRLAAGPAAQPRAAVQFLYKRFPGGARLLWARGGPLGEPALWNAEMRRAAAKAAGGWAAYLRVCSYAEGTPELERQLASAGWKRPEKPLNKNGTFLLDLAPEPAALEQALSSNWGHNLRRGRKRAAVRPWEDPRPAELAAVYRAMEGYKGLKQQHGEHELASLLAKLGPRVRLFRADGEGGAPIALRACAFDGDKAWDLLAASSEAGRKSYASYALLWALIEDCRARGARRYDLGGADAEQARGVFDFKKGTGARFIQYLGEWDWAAPAWARRAMGAAVALRAAS